MFDFNKTKKKIYEWAHDSKGNDERLFEIIEQILKPVCDITSLWELNNSYLEIGKEITILFGNLYDFNDALNIIKNTCKESLENGILPLEEALKVLEENGYSFKSDSDLKSFSQIFTELRKLFYIKKSIKKSIIQEKYLNIFGNLRLINLMRRQNGVYSSVIGLYENIEAIVGEDGEKIQIGDDNAISYVENIEDFKNFLENEKELIFLRQEERKLR